MVNLPITLSSACRVLRLVEVVKVEISLRPLSDCSIVLTTSVECTPVISLTIVSLFYSYHTKF